MHWKLLMSYRNERIWESFFKFSRTSKRFNYTGAPVWEYINLSAAAATFSLQISKNSIFHLLALIEILYNFTQTPKIYDEIKA